MTALLCSDPVWTVNKRDTLTSKGIFSPSPGLMTPVTILKEINLLKTGKDCWGDLCQSTRIARGGISALGPIKWYQEREGNE